MFFDGQIRSRAFSENALKNQKVARSVCVARLCISSISRPGIAGASALSGASRIAGCPLKSSFLPVYVYSETPETDKYIRLFSAPAVFSKLTCVNQRAGKKTQADVILYLYNDNFQWILFIVYKGFC